MTEAEALDWFIAQFGQERTDRIAQFLTMVTDENRHQNLISPNSIDAIWVRHALDSAQLLAYAPVDGRWIDVGTGGGFPGIIVALLRDGPTVMVEPRKRRAEFLVSACATLALTNTTIVASKIEQCHDRATIISARAVASVEKLLQATAHCATPTTRWILPRGRIDPDDIARSRQGQGGRLFHVEQSLTDPGSSILIVDNRR